eukprot:170300_1
MVSLVLSAKSNGFIDFIRKIKRFIGSSASQMVSLGLSAKSNGLPGIDDQKHSMSFVSVYVGSCVQFTWFAILAPTHMRFECSASDHARDWAQFTQNRTIMKIDRHPVGNNKYTSSVNCWPMTASYRIMCTFESI